MKDLDIDLDTICARLGFDETPEVLEAAATPLRRGHHLALLAGEGSGKAAVMGLAVLEGCDPSEEALQATILVADAGHAWRAAGAVQRVVGPDSFVVACPSAGDDARVSAAAHVLVGRPSELLPEIRAGRYSISALRVLIIDGVADLHELDEWSSVEPILETLPKESHKIAISDRPEPVFTRLIERQLPRARRWPEELLPTATALESDAPDPPRGEVRCALVPEEGFISALERCVGDADGLGSARVDIVCRTPEAAARAASELAVAGMEAAREQDGPVVRVALPGEGPTAVVQVGLPFRLERLAAAFAGEGPRYAVIEPRHAPQMDLHLRRLRRPMRSLRGEALREELDPMRRYRNLVREAADSANVMSELLVLEPLFEELGAVRVAAVLSQMFRHREERRDEHRAPVRPWADVEAASTMPAGDAPPAGHGRKRRRAEEPPRGARSAWTRLYFGVGRRDEAKPGDLVGAITGEAGIAGAQIGKIEIMGNFSLVEVDSQVADAVMRQLDGATIRGRTVPVRRDREG